MAEIRIGTSGYHYNHWRGTFYPEKLPQKQWLSYYLEHFDTVELNNTFYRLPTFDAMNAWRENTPPNFLFAVKGSRFITHNLKLSRPENAIHNILPRAETLGKKLGPILWQLPPKWRVNAQRLEEFLQALPTYHRYVFELREFSWLTAEIYALLERYNAAFCIYEIAGFQSPMITTSDVVYVRLHGPGEKKYQGSYERGTLRRWARQIENWYDVGKNVYVYFDNDEAGYAPHNAIALKKMLSAPRMRVPTAAA
jgi:uncharacterized protein YecE (DUF72 family)